MTTTCTNFTNAKKRLGFEKAPLKSSSPSDQKEPKKKSSSPESTLNKHEYLPWLHSYIKGKGKSQEPDSRFKNPAAIRSNPANLLLLIVLDYHEILE